ncbi:MAG: phosphoribosylanthranilate isomerase [Caulobacteraceae bacterium]
MAQSKICGLSTPEAVARALEGGAAYIGFNFFPKSPRHVTADVAARLANLARNKAKVVAITVDASDSDLDKIVQELKPDLIQLHGRETPNRAADIRARTGIGVVRAISVSSASDIDAAAAFDGAADHLMFDAKASPDAALPGGNGVAFDWTLLKGRRFSRPWFLAGGLDPWNVEDAVRASGAPLVDVSSGVERGPGLKDPDLISAFLNAVRRA